MLHLDMDQDASVLSATTHFTVASHRIEGEIILLFEIGSFEALRTAVDQAVLS